MNCINKDIICNKKTKHENNLFFTLNNILPYVFILDIFKDNGYFTKIWLFVLQNPLPFNKKNRES